MALWTDLVTPASLTTVARTAFEERDDVNNTLARFLPNQFYQDMVVPLTATITSQVEVAEYRSYDAETPIVSGSRGSRQMVELPALGQKERISEYDQLRVRGGNVDPLLRDAIGRAVINRAKAIADRMELQRGRVLVTGHSQITENGFIADVDFGRSSELSRAAGTAWTEHDSANPVTDLLAWQAIYSEINGETPGFMLVSTPVITDLMQNEVFRNPQAPTSVFATLDQVNGILAGAGLPTIVRYDRTVRLNGKVQRIIPENTVILLPNSGTSALGETAWGTTLESYEANYQIAAQDRPGIVAGAYKDEDPMGAWAKAAAIGMPVLSNPDLAMTITVK